MTGDELQQYRMLRCLTQSELARLAGLHINSIKRLEQFHSRHVPKSSKYAMEHVAYVLGIPDAQAHHASVDRSSFKGTIFEPHIARASWGHLKSSRSKCGAKTRKGTPCQAPALNRNGRCKLHGGLSTGPRTPEGRARSSEGSRRWHARRRRAGRLGS